MMMLILMVMLLFDVDDDLPDVAGLFLLALIGCRHAHVHDLLLLRILKGHGEEDHQQEEHVHQRRELHGRGLDGMLLSEIHSGDS
jgi:hypothetical protein